MRGRGRRRRRERPRRRGSGFRGGSVCAPPWRCARRRWLTATAPLSPAPVSTMPLPLRHRLQLALASGAHEAVETPPHSTPQRQSNGHTLPAPNRRARTGPPATWCERRGRRQRTKDGGEGG
eukprot:2518835-Rhodomonas_salina.1